MSNTISIAYSSPTLPVLRGGRLMRSLPSSWQEMEPSAIWPCVEMIMQTAPRHHLVKFLLDLPHEVYRRIDRGQMYDLLQCIAWMQVPLDTRPLAPYFDHKSKGGRITRLYLPSDKFSNVVGMEYALIDDKYPAFRKDLDPDIEAQMIAIILRPAGKNRTPSADQRVQLESPEQTQQWLPIVRALPEGVRTYMSMLISANRQLIYDSYRRWLFASNEPSSDEQQEQPSNDSGLDFGWWGAFMDIAEDGVFGDYERVLQTDIHTICMHMVRKVSAARAEKQALEHAAARAKSRF